jgi:hypothetical protein
MKKSNTGALLAIAAAIVFFSYRIHERVMHELKRVLPKIQREYAWRTSPDALRRQSADVVRSNDPLQELIDTSDVILKVKEVRRSGREQQVDYEVSGKGALVQTRTFALAGNVCATTTPTLTIPQEVSTITQSPGRKLIALFINRRDALLFIKDDIQGFPQNIMLVEVDIDPVNMSGWSKGIEAWSFCRGAFKGFVQASMIGGFGVGTICSPLTSGNDFRSGCTNSQMMVIVRPGTDELWFRKPGFLGFWYDVAILDSSIWNAFGGKRVRFIWRSD